MQVGKQIQHLACKEKIYPEIWLKSSLSAVNPFPTGTRSNLPYYQNLLLLSKVFEVSLDQLIKGDVETMKQIIHDQRTGAIKKMEEHIFQLEVRQ